MSPPSAHGRSLRVVDGRSVRAHTWLLAVALLVAAAAVLVALRLSLDAVARDSGPPPAPPVGAAPR